MRYLLLLRGLDPNLRRRSLSWVEEVTSFLARFDDELASRSELEWSEVLAPVSQATIVGLSGSEHGADTIDDASETIARVWAVRVADRARAVEISRDLAEALGTRIEMRECMPSSQKP